MKTVILVSESVHLLKKALEAKISKEIQHEPVNDSIVDDLLSDYFSLTKLSPSLFNGMMKTNSSSDISVIEIRPDIKSIERAVAKRKVALESGNPERVFEALTKFESVFSKNTREVQNFRYEIPEHFFNYEKKKLEQMLWFKVSNSYEYPASGIYKSVFYFAWHEDAEEYQLLNRVPGLTLLNASPFESYAISMNNAQNGVIKVEIDSNDFFSMYKYTPYLRKGFLNLKQEILFASRRIDPQTEFLSRDKGFVKPILRQALERMEKVFTVHSLLYDGLMSA